MRTTLTIAVDAMGGDFGSSVTVLAAITALAKYPNLLLILVGNESVLQQALRSCSDTENKQRLIIHHASETVEMNELPSHALRTKKDSSMRVAIDLVKQGKAQGCVSAGNTGALMATARFVLKTLPGVDRPAIISAFPTIVPSKNVRILDLGANVDSSAENLVQFAIMGSVLASAIDNIKDPKVCLLNIGAEETKGNEQVKQTAQLLSNSQLINYTGFIEGDALYDAEADVIVCDGFVGNVALKTTEGVAILISKLIKQAFFHNSWTKLAGFLVRPILRSFMQAIDPAKYNGAMFIGLQGTVIKSHGSANVLSFVHAIEEAIQSVEKNIPEKIRAGVAPLLKAPGHVP